jgi:hypothetical protein
MEGRLLSYSQANNLMCAWLHVAESFRIEMIDGQVLRSYPMTERRCAGITANSDKWFQIALEDSQTMVLVFPAGYSIETIHFRKSGDTLLYWKTHATSTDPTSPVATSPSESE